MPKGGAVIFLRHEIYTNTLGSIEAVMYMEGQIMCVEQFTFQMSSVAFLGSQNEPKSLAVGALQRLQHSADPLAGFKGAF